MNVKVEGVDMTLAGVKVSITYGETQVAIEVPLELIARLPEYWGEIQQMAVRARQKLELVQQQEYGRQLQQKYDEAKRAWDEEAKTATMAGPAAFIVREGELICHVTAPEIRYSYSSYPPYVHAAVFGTPSTNISKMPNSFMPSRRTKYTIPQYICTWTWPFPGEVYFRKGDAKVHVSRTGWICPSRPSDDDSVKVVDKPSDMKEMCSHCRKVMR